MLLAKVVHRGLAKPCKRAQPNVLLVENACFWVVFARNVSFANLENQLRDCAGFVLDDADVIANDISNTPEIVPLS